MLKKAGIVVATAAAGLLALSPLAFAGEHKGHGHGHGADYDQTNVAGESSQGLVNVSDINANVPVNALNCVDANIPAAAGFAESIVAPIAGAVALLGYADNDQANVIDDSCSNAQGASTVDTVTQGNDDQD